MAVALPEDVPTDPVESELRWTLDPQVKHLNHGSFGAVPAAVQVEQQRLRELMEKNPVRWFSALAERVAEARYDIAQILGVDPATLALVQNASAGASVVFNSLLGQGPIDVLVTDHGYGAVTMGAQRLAARTGGSAYTIRIPLNADADEVVAIVEQQLRDLQPTLMVIDQVTSATARAFPTARICQTARRWGVLSLVDGAHAPGVLADPVEREADFWFGNLHKFACAPRGTAVLVAPTPEALFPLIDSWGGQLGFPERFDHVGTQDVTQWLVAPYAWRHIDQVIGWEVARERSASLITDGARIVAEALVTHVDQPTPDVGQPVGPMRLLRLPEGLGRTREEADALRIPFGEQAGVAASFTSFESRGFMRLSAHVYNSLDDFQHLAAVGVPLLHRWSLEPDKDVS